MTPADKRDAAGIILTGLGSTLAMFGIYLQANGYFAFHARDFFAQIFSVLATLISEGTAKAKEQLAIAAAFGRKRGEDPTHSLIGFDCVFFGFLLQMASSALLFVALFANERAG